MDNNRIQVRSLEALKKAMGPLSEGSGSPYYGFEIVENQAIPEGIWVLKQGKTLKVGAISDDFREKARRFASLLKLGVLDQGGTVLFEG